MCDVRIQRRTVLSLLAGFAGLIVGVVRSFAWPSGWWRKPEKGEEAAPIGPAPVVAAADSSGVKITTIEQRTSRDSAQESSRDPSVFYVRGDWRRFELPRTSSGFVKPDGSSGHTYGPRIAKIVRPDLGKEFQLNLDASQFAEGPFPQKKPRPFTKKQMEELGIPMHGVAGSTKPTFRIETTTKDTGERKTLFGYAARHVITTRKEVPLEGSSRSPQETITDAWYIDLEPRFYPTVYPQNLRLDESGKQHPVHAYASAHAIGTGKPAEFPEFVDIGEPEAGFAVEETRASRISYKMPDGSTRESEQTSKTTRTIEKGTYDAALFEVPRGFKRVRSIDPNPPR
jgi:hypothetical protein